MTQQDIFINIKKSQDGDSDALELLVVENMGLVKSIAVRFRDRGAEFDDLCQIGVIGMIKAIRNFDLGHGTMFSTYAVPLIIGEIKKFLRDDGLIKVSRELKRKGYMIMRAKDEFIFEKERDPTIGELAEKCGLQISEIVESLDAVMSVMSFSDPVGEIELGDLLGNDNINELCENLALRQAIAALPEDEKQLIYYRFYKGLSQSAVGELFGMTQVKISRKEKKIVEKLRGSLV